MCYILVIVNKLIILQNCMAGISGVSKFDNTFASRGKNKKINARSVTSLLEK